MSKAGEDVVVEGWLQREGEINERTGGNGAEKSIYRQMKQNGSEQEKSKKLNMPKVCLISWPIALDNSIGKWPL